MRKFGKNTVVNVRQVDQYAGVDGAYIDRCISDLQNSHSQITLCCQDTFNIDSAASNVNGIIAGPQVAIFDEFVSIQAQFETFRIRAIKFDIYDVNPSNSSVGWFSTFHDQFSGAAQPTFTVAGVVDGPDSQLVPPGTGKLTLYWRAKGTLENGFVTDDDVGVTQPPLYSGGLRYSVGANTAARKFQVVVNAIVDFRGRV